MFFRGGRLPSKASVLVGPDRQGGPLWLCTVVLVLAAQVIPRAVLTFLDIFASIKYTFDNASVCPLNNLYVRLSFNNFA